MKKTILTAAALIAISTTVSANETELTGAHKVCFDNIKKTTRLGWLDIVEYND